MSSSAIAERPHCRVG